MISISVMVFPTTRKANMARGLPPGAHTAPGAPSMSASWAAWALPGQGVRHGPSAPHLGRQEGRSLFAVGGCRFDRGAVGAENGVGVEQGDERFEVPLAGRGQEGLDYRLLAVPISGLRLVAALDSPPSPAGQLAGGGRRAVDDRRDVLEWHREQVV